MGFLFVRVVRIIKEYISIYRIAAAFIASALVASTSVFAMDNEIPMDNEFPSTLSVPKSKIFMNWPEEWWKEQKGQDVEIEGRNYVLKGSIVGTLGSHFQQDGETSNEPVLFTRENNQSSITYLHHYVDNSTIYNEETKEWDPNSVVDGGIYLTLTLKK